MTLIPDLPWNVGLPSESPLILPFKILKSALLQISKSRFPWLFKLLSKLFRWVAHNEDSEKSFVIILLPSWQTLSGCLPTLELKSPNQSNNQSINQSINQSFILTRNVTELKNSFKIRTCINKIYNNYSYIILFNFKHNSIIIYI